MWGFFMRYLGGQENALDTQLAKDMSTDSFTDEDYRRIYGDDEEAIKQAKASWARAGQQVLAQTHKRKGRK